MNNKNLSTADIADRHRRYMALALLIVALIFLSKAAEHLVSSDLLPYVEAFQIIMALTTMGLFAPILTWKVRHSSMNDRFVYFSEDGFAAHALIFAQKRSWVITFFMLVLLEALDRTLSDVPSNVLLEIVLAVMLGSMSLMFLYKVRQDDDFEAEVGDISHA